MDRKVAGMVLLVLCVLLAILLLEKAISPLLGGSVFALALATLGLLSGGFRNRG